MSSSKITNLPRVVVAALKGGAGKTFLTVGLVAALRKRGLNVGVFKKGPDYIDAGWLGMAAGRDCYNLDAFLFPEEIARESFLRKSAGSDVSIVEGNRGLFDGVDAKGSYSTAELAKLVNAPVILIVDATKITRTAAAMVLGCKLLDPDLRIEGVILNRVAGTRHETVLREAIESAAHVPVLGSVAKLPLENFPQRHLGLLPLYEHPQAAEFVDQAAEIVERAVDLEKVLAICQSAEHLEIPDSSALDQAAAVESKPLLRIGILKDSAFQFYYPENLEALRNAGADLIFLSALVEKDLPELDALYIGGGFPETHAEALARNDVFKNSLRSAVENGLPVYAECGGLMYLSRNLLIDRHSYPMVGVFPVDSVLERNPQGHGYIQVEVQEANPFYPEGTVLKGHEFHYSYVTGLDRPGASYAFRVVRGHGMDGHRDGICCGNALGTYVHVHALGQPEWARCMIQKARAYRQRK